MEIPKKRLSDGQMIPVLGLGTWQLEGEACVRAVEDGLRLGYRHIDTAFAYYNEKEISRAIRSFPRERLFLTTKLWREFHDPKKVEEGCDRSLRDLGVSHVDLYLLHWPERKNMVEILGAMHRLREKGKVKSVGICNATVGHLEELQGKKISVVVNQVEYHPLLNQQALLAFCKAHGIAVTAYCPIARGEVSKEKAIVEIGKKYRKSAAQVSLRWLLQKEIVVIPKSSTEAHLRENCALFDFVLSPEEMARIDGLSRNHRLIHPEFSEF